MKTHYFLLLIILAFCLSNSVAQTVTVEIDKDNIKYEVKLDSVSQFIHVPNGDGYDLQYEKEGKFGSVTALANNSNKYNINSLYGKSELDGKSINYKLIKVDSSDTVLFTIRYEIPKPETSTERLTKMPYPTFSKNSDSAFKRYRRNRHLIIDANPNPNARLNTQLFKYKKEKTSEDLNEETDKGSATSNDDNKEKVVKEFLGKAHAIPKNGSITVFIKNYNFWDVEEISISMNEQDYTYSKGLIDVRNQVVADDEDPEKIDEKQEDEKEAGQVREKLTPDPLVEYLENVYKNWNSIQYLNFNDLDQVENYKDSLTKSVNKYKKELTPAQQDYYSKIISWYPDYVSLTPIPLSSVDADEVEFKLKLKNENETTETEYDLRTYRIVGGLSFNISSTLFLTGLVSGSVYADSVEIDSVKQLRAKIDDTSKAFTAGIGVNTEITWRSGWMVSPTASIGFFVPFDEDITPNIALGGGLSLITKRVRLSLTGGLAIGQVNAIEDRYVDRNLADFPNLINENLSTKRWDNSWQVGIGLSYKLKE